MNDVGCPRYGGGMDWATTLTAAGALLGGLALPIAFIQLGAQRRDALRAQVDKVGAWHEHLGRVFEQRQLSVTEIIDLVPMPEPEPPPGPPQWDLTVFIRNSSELPVLVPTLELSVRPWGYGRLPKEGAPGSDYAGKRLGQATPVYIAPGTIAPGQTWSREITYTEPSTYDQPQPPMVSVARVVVTDAAGRQWEIRPYRTGPPRRVRWWLRRRWEREGNV